MADSLTTSHTEEARPIALDAIRAAAERIKGAVVRTPCLKSRTLSDMTGAEIHLKFENRQFTASFKERGALNRLLQLTEEERAAGVVAPSAGNHAQGVAHHARRLGISAAIVMPAVTPLNKVRAVRAFGAKTILTGETVQESMAAAEALAAEEGRVLIHPFDDPEVCAGQGTLALEMLEDAPDLDAVVIPVGGGGLLAGCAAAFKAERPDIKLYGVESAMYPSLAQALSGKGVGKSGGFTIAEGIAVKRAGAHGVAAARAFDVATLAVGEEPLERAVALLVNVEKTVAEGAGAAGLAAVLARKDLFKGKRVGVPICGGNIDARLLASVLVRDLARERRLISFRMTSQDAPGELGKIADIIGAEGGNIVEVQHNRLALDVPAKGTEFDFLIETRDGEHADALLAALEKAGYAPRAMGPEHG